MPSVGEKIVIMYSKRNMRLDPFAIFDLKWGSFQTLEQLETTVDQLLAELTSEVVTSLTGYPFI